MTPKPKATPAQVRQVLIASGCLRYGKADVPNASEAARRTETTHGYWRDLLREPPRNELTVSRLREHAATLGLAPERIDQILPLNDGK